MIDADSELFLEFPGASARVLYRGAITASQGASVTARFRAPAVHAKPGSEMRVYRTRGGRFTMQFACVMKIDDWISTDDQITSEITVQTIGKPVPAERRCNLRVSAYGSDMRAEVNGEPNCEVLDISDDGLSVLASSRLGPGMPVEISLTMAGETLSGQGSVQNVRQTGSGQTRYGIAITAPDSELAKAMGRITKMVREQQLQKLTLTA